MTRKSHRVTFPNHAGDPLVGVLDTCDRPRYYAIFSHCFTCSKDLKAIVRISRRLAEHGIGVLRFDFTGLGDSHGVFADSNFETNQQDILSAVDWLVANYEGPEILIGHSLGGTALMASTHSIPSARALATLASPSNTHHLVDTLLRLNPSIEVDGQGEVVIGGRTHLVKTQLLDSLRRQDMRTHIESIKIPHLVLHSPTDETLSYSHAENMFEWTGGPKAFVTLPGSDHLLVNQPEDVGYVADLIAVWAKRFLTQI